MHQNSHATPSDMGTSNMLVRGCFASPTGTPPRLITASSLWPMSVRRYRTSACQCQVEVIRARQAAAISTCSADPSANVAWSRPGRFKVILDIAGFPSHADNAKFPGPVTV